MTKENEIEHRGAYLILGKPELPNSIEIGRRFDLDSDKVWISNQRESKIPVPTSTDKAYTVMLSKDDEGWSFENHGQSGSTSLNGFLSEEKRLRDGDLLKIGGTVFHFLEGIGVLSGIYDQLFRATRLDLQTGAYNKAHFNASLEDWINLSKRHKQSLSLIILDIDHFGKVNTNYGHMGGDAAIKQVVDRIHKRARKGDVFCRIGNGEEFALILPETPKENAVLLAEIIRQEIAEEPCPYEDRLISITVSIGVGEYMEGLAKDDFVKSVDSRMYEAKNAGRNKVVA